MINGYDNVLLVAFGGPTEEGCGLCDLGCPGLAACFIKGIVGDTPSNQERITEVAAHYNALGGTSPFNKLTFGQASALQDALSERNIKMPVRAGMRHWRPYLKDVIGQISDNGERHTLAVIMAPHQSKVSWEWYQQVVTRATNEIGEGAPIVKYLDPWFEGPGYAEAIADLIREKTRDLGEERFNNAALVFTAHSIPVSVAEIGPYSQQFEATAAAVAEYLGKDKHTIAYQSQAHVAGVPWTSPDINDLIRSLKQEGVEDMIVSPIGFLCDHIEVLYDLDVEAKETAAECGIGFWRAETVGSHPKFIGMIADLISDRVGN